LAQRDLQKCPELLGPLPAEKKDTSFHNTYNVLFNLYLLIYFKVVLFSI
jgi:hypothetical protein